MKAEELMDAIGALDESLVNPDVQMIQNHQPISENDAEQTVPLRARKHRGTVLTWVGAAAAVALIAFGGWLVLGRAAKQRNGPGALQASQPASATGEATSTNHNETTEKILLFICIITFKNILKHFLYFRFFPSEVTLVQRNNILILKYFFYTFTYIFHIHMPFIKVLTSSCILIELSVKFDIVSFNKV